MKPVAITDPLRIERLGELGEGLAAWQGSRVAVPYTLPGELVRVKLAGREKDQIFARIDSIVESAPARRPAPCRHFATCGGCALQHLEAEAYRGWKTGRLTAALAHYRISPDSMDSLIESPPQSRRRAVFSARHTMKNGLRFGFNEKKAHWIVDLEECPVLLPELQRFMVAFRPVLADVLAPGDKLDVFVNALDHGLDVLLLGEFEPKLEAVERLAGFARDFGLARLGLKSRKFGATPFAEMKPATCRFGQVEVAIPPGAFLQATAQGEAAMVRIVRDSLAAHVPAGKPVADLFAGCGTLGLPHIDHYPVQAFESDRRAVASLDRVARGTPKAGAHRFSAYDRNLFDAPLRAEELAEFSAVIIDPPRAGAAAQTQELARSKVPLAVYISCNPQSFARDAQTLIAGGYRLARVTPIDQFLWSHHLEVGGVFVR